MPEIYCVVSSFHQQDFGVQRAVPRWKQY